jgi:hypothetical protein
MTGDRVENWLLNEEPLRSTASLGYDPYAIWVTRLNGMHVERLPARLLAYADEAYQFAAVIYLDGRRETVRAEQMTDRRPEPFSVLAQPSPKTTTSVSNDPQEDANVDVS